MQERIHPHIDRRTRELVETATELKFFVTPENEDGEIIIMVLIKHCCRLLDYVELIWRGKTIAIKHLSDKVARIRIYSK